MEMKRQLHSTAALYTRSKNLDTHCIGGWVGTRGGLDISGKRKMSFPSRYSKPGTFSLVTAPPALLGLVEIIFIS
jgi:hypothetical protein